MKADKWQELSELMHKSISKVSKIKDKQKQDHKLYKKQQLEYLTTQEKDLKEEQTRINEGKEEIETKKQMIQKKVTSIDERVYKDTIEPHTEKHKLDGMIEDLDKDIENMERVLRRKRKEREMLVLEKEVHERKIQQARWKYKDQTDGHDQDLEQVTQSLEELEKAQLSLDQNLVKLQESQDQLNSNVDAYQEEKTSLGNLK